MNRIAIFVSGAGEAAERIVRLFNEGNRVHTELVVLDESSSHLAEILRNKGVIVITVSQDDWKDKTPQIVNLIKEKGVSLLVLDNFELVIPDEIMETTDGELIRVSSPEVAPREVVAALEADFKKPEETPVVEKVEEENPTLESEWADTLKIQFTPPKIPVTPPELPTSEGPEAQPEPQQPEFPQLLSDTDRPQMQRPASCMPNEPMPSTWLIWSILVTVFCCFIPGIIAIIFSTQVSARYYAGDIEGARRSSRQAEIWIIVSVVLGVLAATLYIPFMMIG